MPIKTRKHIMWFVYILRCRDNSLYTGITTDLDKRLARHNTGQGAKYTASRIPVKIVYYEEHPDKSSAIAREHSLKGLTKAKKEELVASSLVNKIDFLYYSKEKIS